MEVRARILDGSTKLFLQYGIRNITMDEIAMNLEMSKRTIYENFKDKNELLKSCLEKLIEEQKHIKEEIIKNSGNVIEAIFTFIKNSVGAFKTINPLFISDLQKHYAEIWNQTFKQNEEKSLNETYTLLRKGINEGIFRKEINIEIITKIFHEQLKILADEDIFPSDKYPKAEVFENIVINFTRGISTKKGLEIIETFIINNIPE